jgi:DNA-binding MurR/RpiR family transcriptional regulator
MTKTPQYALRIKQCYPDLVGKHRSIADYILANPEHIVSRKVKEIAAACECDDALVIRFCQKIGYQGFRDLKTSIASEFMPKGSVHVGQDSQPGDPFSQVKANFLQNNSQVMHDTIGLLAESVVEEVVDLLAGAGRIFLMGVGSSGIVAMDTQIKLMRLGCNTVFHQDSGLARMLFGLVEPGDVVLAISFSGETGAVCASARAAARKGAKVIAVTNFPQSTLAQCANLVLLTASDENSFRIGAMTSRIAQYLIIDFLMINLALRDLDKSGGNVLRTHQMIDQD